MTKREICERLIDLRDQLETGWQRNDVPTRELCRDAVYDLRDLILDLAAPEEEDRDPYNTGMHDEYDLDENGYVRAIHTCENEPEPKHLGVIAKPGKDGEIEWCWCQKCYAQAAVVHNPFGDGENWSYCKTCGVSFRLKREEGEKEPEKEEGDKAWYEICPWRRPGKNNIGLECSPLYCSQCVHKTETHKTPFKGVEKIVDPTGKNPTVYKCPFCNAFTITQDGTTCIVGDPNGKCSQCGRVIMLLGERKEGDK